MTAIGMTVNPDQAMLWADTMVFDDRGPIGHVAKLIVNPTARLAAAGAGWGSLLHCADALAMAATSLDRLVDQLPALLRRKAADCAERREDPSDFAMNAYVLAGWSDEYRRIAGYVLAADRYFEPEIASTFAAPDVPDLAAIGADTPDDIEPVAIDQIAELRRRHRCEITGRVVIATIRPNEVTARTLLSLDAWSAATAGTGAAVALEGATA
ncbi:hypothetical protein [Acidiphilium sp.]|uniref:hypothetical protein n=1 Tax=Acidiphilium sp. TaxID=527 RepID=UPI00258649DF|nr:hypothetical protein [Acidiphilium sp.]